MKWNIYRVLALILLVPLSIGFGFAFDGTATAIERATHPRDEAIAPLVKEYSAQCALPEHILWATVLTCSDFVSNAVSTDGRIGLMQIKPETYAFVCTEIRGGEAQDAGLLYEPKTNLLAGAEWLSYLYQRYGVWETAYAAYYAGTDTVDAWLADESLRTPLGTIREIPDKSCRAFVKDLGDAVEMYAKLYYQS
ncbi:MAG: transglycosylase SLT domain-containing protein [Clostridia bacterium]|nr:transglycosylase SLT domain-containing protein [Clostridia bacterium]